MESDIRTGCRYLYSKTHGQLNMAEYEGGTESIAVPLHSEGAIVKLKFALLPHVCALTGRRIWLEKAYRTYERYYGYNGEGITYVHWVDQKEYIKWKLMR